MTRPDAAIKWLEATGRVSLKTETPFDAYKGSECVAALLTYIKELEEKVWMYDKLSH